MTVISQPRTRTSTPASTVALATLVAAVAVNVVIVEILYVTGKPAQNAVLGVGTFLGLHAALLVFLQLTLVSRLPWLDRRLGMDRLTAWHRWTGFTLFWVILAHATFIVLGYMVHYRLGFWAQVVSLAGSTGVKFGLAAATIIVVAVATSVRFVRRRLSYEAWHTVHFAIYVALFLAILHQFVEGTSFRVNTVATVYWWALWAWTLGALLAGRLIVPLVRNARHRFEVAAVVPESDDAVSVYVRGRHLERLPVRAGQFFLWRFPGHNRWWQVNPFSLSAAPDGRTLRLTAKGIGTTSAGLRRLRVGARVFAEGPYGAFTTLQRCRDATLLIAGGIGVTPIRSLLEDEELTGPVTVLYRVPGAAEAVLLDELRALADRRGAQLHLLTGRTGAGSPPNQPLGAENLRALVPDVTERDVYVCGPPAMTTAVLRALRELGVPRRQLHAERFRLAA
jgi:predicted ferric reductase